MLTVSEGFLLEAKRRCSRFLGPWGFWLPLILVLFSSGTVNAVPDPRDSVILESKAVNPSNCPVAMTVRVSITNKDTLMSVILPVVIRSLSGGAFVIIARPRTVSGTLIRLTSTIDFIVTIDKTNGVSPDSFRWFGSTFSSAYEPPNSVRKGFWEIKFDTIRASLGTVEIDSTTINTTPVLFEAKDLTQVPVNFVKSTITVVPPCATNFDFQASIQHFGEGRRGSWRWVRIRCENQGTCAIGATVTWNIPSQAASAFVYPRAYPISGGASQAVSASYDTSNGRVIWNLPSVPSNGGFHLWGRYKIPCSVTDGTPLKSIVRITPVAGDLDSLDNTDSVTVSAVPGPGCSEPSFFSSGAADKEGVKFLDASWRRRAIDTLTIAQVVKAIDTLTYMITFRNEGGGTSTDIVVKDTLDFELDEATFDSAGASHLYTFSVNGREITWTFSGINLPDSTANESGSLGFAAFSIRLKSNLTGGDTVSNQAEVTFDQLPPVATNTLQAELCRATAGDFNDDGVLTASDVVLMLNCAFLGSGDCDICFGDVTCDDILTASDVVNLLNAAFLGIPLNNCP